MSSFNLLKKWKWTRKALVWFKWQIQTLVSFQTTVWKMYLESLGGFKWLIQTLVSISSCYVKLTRIKNVSHLNFRLVRKNLWTHKNLRYYHHEPNISPVQTCNCWVWLKYMESKMNTKLLNLIHLIFKIEYPQSFKNWILVLLFSPWLLELYKSTFN